MLVVLLLGTACGASGADPDAPAPSGALGPVTQADAEEAVLGLCALAGATDAAEAEATFLDRSHVTLHVIAAAAEVRERAAAAALLQAKERVEADLAGDGLPSGFRADVEGLIEATGGALDAIGLAAPTCP